jgi:hypothetical protein
MEETFRNNENSNETFGNDENLNQILNEFFNEYELDTAYFDTKTFSRKLISENNHNSALSSQLSTFVEGYDDEEDPLSFFFEIVINIFMNLLIDYLNLDHILIDYDNHETTNFNPIIEENTIEELSDLIQDKFNKISLTVSITPFENSDFTQNEFRDKYCKIIFRTNLDDQSSFERYSEDIAPDQFYHMLLNGRFERKNRIQDIYATWTINNKVYKISFERFTPVEVMRYDMPNMVDGMNNYNNYNNYNQDDYED